MLKINALWWIEGLGEKSPLSLPCILPPPIFHYAHQGGWRESLQGEFKALVLFPNVHWATRVPLLSGWEVWALPKASGPLCQPDALKEYRWLHDTAGLLTCVCMFVLGCVHNSKAGLRLSKAPCLVGYLDQHVTERDNFHNGF